MVDFESIDPIYIDEKEVSAITGKSVQGLRVDRCDGVGIPYIKDGRRVRYFKPDVYRHMEAQRVETAERSA